MVVRLLRVCLVSLVSLVFTACGSAPSSESSFSEDHARYPQFPDTAVTPGALCDRPNTHRYPENIAYCERNVSTATKRSIIREYDERLGYSIGSMDRMEFKIDHFFPLCMGGSNDRVNLWPQHKTVYVITDPLEPKICDLMASGDIQQQEAMDVVRRAKFNLDQVSAIMDELNARSSRHLRDH